MFVRRVRRIIDVALGNEAGDVLLPFLSHSLAEVEIKLAVNDLVNLGIARRERIVGPDRPSTIAAILRSVLGRLGLECRGIFGIREPVFISLIKNGDRKRVV